MTASPERSLVRRDDGTSIAYDVVGDGISEALLPDITAPLLSVHGTRPPADYQAWLTRLVPTAVVEVWDGLGHFLHLVAPTRFAARLADLLR